VEILLFIGAVVALDVAAVLFGYDSRDSLAFDHHDRAIAALRRGDLGGYREELRELERDVQRIGAVRY
jgi:hypothetical protein